MIPVCVLALDSLLPLVMAGEGDFMRGERDVGRAHSRRACVLAAEAVRNLCLCDSRGGGRPLLEHRPSLGRELLSVASSHTTTDRLRGAAMEALAALTSISSSSSSSSSSCSRTKGVAQGVARRLVNARWVTDRSGMQQREV